MSGIKFGNLSPERFAEIVDTEFTEGELATLHGAWSQHANLRDAEDFHIFSDPGVSVHVGSKDSAAMKIFTAANERRRFSREVTFHLAAASFPGGTTTPDGDNK